MDTTQMINTATDLVIQYLPKIGLATITLVIGLKLISILNQILRKSLEKSSVDPALVTFLESFVGIALKIVLFLSIASMLGVETTSILTVLGAGSLAVGLSLQGSLSNFAGGVLIMIFRPFHVGDLIETNDHFGRVRKVQIFYTQLLTPDNKRVIIPNSDLSNESIKNYSSEDHVRIEVAVGIDYAASIEEAKKVIYKVLNDNQDVMKDPSPFIGVKSLGDNAVVLTAWAWTKTQNYIPLPFTLREEIKIALDKANINMPFPQRTIQFKNPENLSKLFQSNQASN